MNEETLFESSTEASERPLKVMIVDDTTVNRQILKVFLERLDFICLSASDGDEALEVFMRDEPDIILMDVMMPHVNGYEATRRIRESSGERWVPVIFISALDRNDNLIDGLEAGGDDFMSKPINFIVLDAKLRSLRRMVQMQRHLAESRQRTAAITNNILEGVITLDRNGLIESANPAICTMFGYVVADELLGLDVRALLGGDQTRASANFLGHYEARESVGRRRNGEEFPLEMAMSRMQFENTELYVAICRDITERKKTEQRLRDNAERLQAYRDHQESEHAFAREIIQRQMARPGLSDKQVRYWVAPAEDFSGDIVAAARDADGRLYALLADGCGHGLAPAISVVPVLTMFYSMVESGTAPELGHIIGGLNRQLLATLPLGRFVAAAMVCLDEKRRIADIWVGGIPMLFWLGADGKLRQTFKSSHLSLGIVDTDDDLLTFARVEWQPGDRFIVCSDGLLESHMPGSSEVFGTDRFTALLESCPAGKDLLTHIRHELTRALGAGAPSDDISVLIVHTPGATS